MAAQPQPIYPDELNLALDNQYTKMTRYMDARFDTIAIQTRTDINNVKQELKTEISQLRQEAQTAYAKLDQRVTNIEATQKAIIDMQRDMLSTMQTIQQDLKAIRQEMKDNHAEAMGAIGDIKLRIVKLENKDEDK